MPDVDTAALRADLERLGAQRDEARRRATELSDEIEPLVRQGHAAGIPIAELARITGIRRPTIQAMVRGKRRW
jgi:hypothetical protein